MCEEVNEWRMVDESKKKKNKNRGVCASSLYKESRGVDSKYSGETDKEGKKAKKKQKKEKQRHQLLTVLLFLRLLFVLFLPPAFGHKTSLSDTPLPLHVPSLKASKSGAFLPFLGDGDGQSD